MIIREVKIYNVKPSIDRHWAQSTMGSLFAFEGNELKQGSKNRRKVEKKSPKNVSRAEQWTGAAEAGVQLHTQYFAPFFIKD